MATSGSSTRRRVPACIGQLLRGQLLEAPYEGCVQSSAALLSLSGIRDAKRPRKSPHTTPPRPDYIQVKSRLTGWILRKDHETGHKASTSTYMYKVSLSAHVAQIGGPCQRQRVTYPPLESGPSCYYHSSNSLICWPVTDNKYSTCTTTRKVPPSSDRESGRNPTSPDFASWVATA